MHAVGVEDLVKRYAAGPGGAAGRPALDGVSFEVDAGELLVLLGPSGCGKSTVLRCIAGLEAPDAGDVHIGGRRVNDLPPKDRDVAMVFQGYALYPHLTVRDNIAFPLRMRRVPRPELDRRVHEAAELLGIGELLARRPGDLSGGERQRVALGRALVREPAVFLFDEPLSNLDARLRTALRAELVTLHRRLGRAALFVTHDQTEAMTMGRRIAVLCEGRLRQLGTPAEIYQRPADTFVAAFVGSPGMNLIDAPARGTDARIGFRPEHGRLGPAGDALVAGRVMLVEQLGSEALVHLRPATGEPVVVRLREGELPELGTEWGVHVDSACLHRFGSNGKRL